MGGQDPAGLRDYAVLLEQRIGAVPADIGGASCSASIAADGRMVLLHAADLVDFLQLLDELEDLGVNVAGVESWQTRHAG